MPHRDDFDDDLMDPSSDAYDYKPIASDEGGSGKAVKLFVAVTVLAGLAGGAWYFVGGDSQSDNDVPLVHASKDPVKVKPADPGGMNVPNRDKTVYDRVAGENTEPKLERLLPRPEKPLDKPVKSMPIPTLEETPDPDSLTPEQVEADTPEVPTAPERAALPDVPTEEMANTITEPAPAKVEEVKDSNAPRALVKRDEQPVKAVEEVSEAPTQQDKDDLNAKIAQALGQEQPLEKEEDAAETETAPKEVKPTQSVKAEPQLKPAPPKATTAPEQKPQSGYMLQLLSSKSKSGVEATHDELKKKHSDIFDALPSTIVRADLGADKGVYYRLRLGPVTEADKAKSLCSQLKQRKVGCFIVRVR